ncbi:MAG: hypothetical protein JXB49_18280 [Bacteroidales bacterium]|nr:hypothetical protein [Bacteroidales bacterium]
MVKNKIKDAEYAVVKAAIASIPIAGAAASELLSLIVASPLEQRREKWMLEAGKAIKDLQEQGLDIEQLRDDPVFIDMIIHTSQLAMQTGENEKREYLKNALVNYVKGETSDQAEMKIFLNLVETYTVWHVRLLKLFDNPKEWYKIHKVELPNLMAASLSSILEIAFPELRDRRDFYDIVWQDLYRAGLHGSHTLHAVISTNSLMVSRTTEIGKRFLRFIQSSDF